MRKHQGLLPNGKLMSRVGAGREAPLDTTVRVKIALVIELCIRQTWLILMFSECLVELTLVQV